MSLSVFSQIPRHHPPFPALEFDPESFDEGLKRFIADDEGKEILTVVVKEDSWVETFSSFVEEEDESDPLVKSSSSEIESGLWDRARIVSSE